VWREHKKLTDQITPQWKQVLQDLRVKVTYTLSPQAKGKVEKVDIRIVPDEKNGISVLRFWYNRKIIDVKRVKNTDLEGARF